MINKNIVKKKVSKFYRYRIMPRLQKAVGMDVLEDSFYLFLNSATDITACRPATGALRALQLADTELMKIVDLLCRKNGLRYWLDWGTLLGAARHKGFIPWDDDLDITMPADDYKKLYPILQAFCAEHPDFALSDSGSVDRDWMWINYKADGTHLDIFPVYSFDISDDASADSILRTVAMYYDDPLKRSRNAGTAENGKTRRIYYHPSDVWNKLGFFSEEEIFPLEETVFEGLTFFAPKEYHIYLTKEYGDYMLYPRDSMLHHKLLLECAEKNKSELTEENLPLLRKIRVSLENEE